jgi:cytochrome c oxidase assembly factor CtaG
MALRKSIYIDFSYLIILAASFGAVIVLGAVVAPVIFHSDKILLSITLDHYNAGIIMGEIFHRFSYWLYFVAAFVVVYEIVKYKMGQRDALTLASAITVVFSSLMFSAVYSPKILSMQAIGVEATQSDTFSNIHIASEIDFKILALSLIVLFVRRLMLLRVS